VSPVQVRVEPVPIETLASAPPETVTQLSAPAFTAQVVVPAQVETQSAKHVELHVEPPAHEVVHPVPQATLHVFWLLQSYVTLFVTVPPSPPSPASVPPPKTHVPP
jgi:hypothetical protein